MSLIQYKKDKWCWEHITAISTKCTQHCKHCKMCWFVIQTINQYVSPHTDWRSGDQSVIKGCFRGDQSSFSSVCRFSSKKFFWNYTSRTELSLCYRWCTFGCDRSVMQDNLPEKQATSWLCLGFRWRDFPNNSQLSL